MRVAVEVRWYGIESGKCLDVAEVSRLHRKRVVERVDVSTNASLVTPVKSRYSRSSRQPLGQSAGAVLDVRFVDDVGRLFAKRILRERISDGEMSL
jgi:hypothetical protein